MLKHRLCDIQNFVRQATLQGCRLFGLVGVGVVLSGCVTQQTTQRSVDYVTNSQANTQSIAHQYKVIPNKVMPHLPDTKGMTVDSFS